MPDTSKGRSCLATCAAASISWNTSSALSRVRFRSKIGRPTFPPLRAIDRDKHIETTTLCKPLKYVIFCVSLASRCPLLIHLAERAHPCVYREREASNHSGPEHTRPGQSHWSLLPPWLSLSEIQKLTFDAAPTQWG